jgi:hypothetical protein
MQRRIGFMKATALIAMAAAGSTIAADLPKEGKYDYTACWSGASNAIAFSDGYSASSYEFTGSVRSNPPGGMFDKNAFRCVGMNAQLGKRPVSSTVCEAVDQDGHKRLGYFWVGPDGKVIREHVTGTGKYEGMVFEGTVQPLGPFPTVKAGTFQNCNRQTGTYKLK